MVKLRSNFEYGSTPWAVRRSQWRALGLTDEDMDKPKIAIVNSTSELSSCFIHLDEVAERVKKGVRDAGGIPFVIHTTAPSDFITNAGKGGRYLMPGRDLIPNDVEAAVEGALLDGMVCLSTCDKTTPGHLMAAARLNLPTVVVIGGYQSYGVLTGQPVDIEDVFESVGSVVEGKITAEQLKDMTETAICSPGVCAGMGTANSMHLCAEALGMTVPGSAPVSAASRAMRDRAEDSGRLVVECIRADRRPRDILTPGAFANAVRACLAVSASINTLRHMQAVAQEAESPVDVYQLFDELGAATPLLAAIRPNGPVRMNEFEDAGGTRGLLATLDELVDRGAITVTGQTRGEVSDEFAKEKPDQPSPSTVIRPLSDPVAPGPAIVVPRGNLAPDGCIVKLGQQDRNLTFTGPAKVYTDQEDAISDLGDGALTEGDVVVLRGLGPRGGPGIASASWFTAALNGSSLAKKVMIVTDGQLSGLNSGIVAGQVTPEAFVGGPIALVEDGDEITLDVAARTLTLNVADDVLAGRAARWTAPATTEKGYLAQYAQLVQPLSKGAVLGARDF